MAQAASTYLGEQRRRSTRLEQSSPLIIRGVDLLGQPFEERTATQNLSFQGCRYASKHHLPKNTWVTLEAPSGESRNEAVCVRARVAWIQRPRTLRELFQVGVELERARNVWNVAFPPTDWACERAAELSIVSANNSANRPGSHKELSLEDYLRLAATAANPKHSACGEGVPSKTDAETLLEDIRHEFSTWSEKGIAESRTEVNEMTGENASAVRAVQDSSQEASAKALYEQWIEEFQREKASAKREIEASVSGDVAVQLANFREQMRDLLASEWVQKLSHVQVEMSKWESGAQELKNELRAHAEAIFSLNDERLNERLAGIQQELERSRALKDAAEMDENSPRPFAEGSVSFSCELEAAREKWNELVESSIDSAARRFTDRITSSSREIVRNSEQEMSSRAMDLQKDAVRTVDAGRVVFEEMREALRSEISEGRNALAEIEQSASAYTEYSRQLDSASRDALDELRGKLDRAIADKLTEMEKKSAELEVTFSEHATAILDGRMRETLMGNRQTIEAATSGALERVKAAAEDLTAHHEATENLLQIHRERLRQFAEQMQRDHATQLTSDLALFDKDLVERRSKAAEQWSEALDAGSAHARRDAFNALASQMEQQLDEAAARLRTESDQALDSARQLVLSEMNKFTDKFAIEIGKIESDQLSRTAGKLAAAAQDQEQAARTEFRKAAEAAASALGEMIVESEGKSFAGFSTTVEEKIQQARHILTSASENTLQRVQTHAQTSFEHFQEQLAIKCDQALQKAVDALERELGTKTDEFRSGGEAALEEWRTQLGVFSAQTYAKHQQDMNAAANSMIEAALEQLERRAEYRVAAAGEATENAVRQSCAGLFEAMAQKIREQSRDVEQNPSESNVGNMGRAEHQASA